CRRAAELRASGAERRLHETEELLDKKTNELFALQRHIISGVGGAGASMVKELEELRRGKREAAARIQQLEEGAGQSSWRPGNGRAARRGDGAEGRGQGIARMQKHVQQNWNAWSSACRRRSRASPKWSKTVFQMRTGGGSGC
ncbi:unnamed protein product, partial [Durusdinium trenchii]